MTPPITLPPSRIGYAEASTGNRLPSLRQNTSPLSLAPSPWRTARSSGHSPAGYGVPSGWVWCISGVRVLAEHFRPGPAGLLQRRPG